MPTSTSNPSLFAMNPRSATESIFFFQYILTSHLGVPVGKIHTLHLTHCKGQEYLTHKKTFNDSIKRAPLMTLQSACNRFFAQKQMLKIPFLKNRINSSLTECHYKPPQPAVLVRSQIRGVLHNQCPLGEGEAKARQGPVTGRNCVAETH